MRSIITIAFFCLAVFSCKVDVKTEPDKNAEKLIGTWKLVTATLKENGRETVTDYTGKNSFIKIINKTHFAFLQHDAGKDKDSTGAFSAGGGSYSLKDSTYTEKLEYCSAREWEGHDFAFTITITGDTLVQHGVEKLEAVGIDRVNTEKYVRMK